MPVTIARGSGSRLQRSSTGFVVRLEAGTPRDPGILEAVRRALADVRAWLLELDDPDPELGLGPGDRNEVAHVSDVMPTPTGGVVYVDGGDVSARRLVKVLDRAVEDLQRHGVEDAVVSVPRPSAALEEVWSQWAGPRLTLVHVPAAALTPPPVPPGWVDAALAWLRGDPELTDEGATALIVSQEFAVGPDDLATVLALDHPERHETRTVMVGPPSTGVRIATFDNRGDSYGLTLGSTGAAVWSVDGFARELAGVAEHLAATCSYAFLELPEGSVLDREQAPPGRPPRSDHMSVVDEVAVDAFPFQILGPGHLRRLGALPDAQPLAGGRVAWRLGAIGDWIDARLATELRRRGRQTLAGVLPDRDALYELGVARMHADIAERRRLRDQP